MTAAHSILSAQTQSAANHAPHWLLNIWEQVLQVRPIHWDVPFGDYGGDAAAAIQVVAAVENVLGRKIGAELLGAESTPYDLFRSIQLQHPCAVSSPPSRLPLDVG